MFREETSSWQTETPVEKPNRLVETTKLMVKALFRAKTEGLENLKEIPRGKRLIFMPTHMSDYDVPIAIAKIGDAFPELTVADASTHEEFKKNPTGYIGRKVGGPENFFSVDFTGGRGDGYGIFNHKNFEPMRQSLESGKPLVIAAYYDTNYQDHNWRLPKKGGYGGAYLSQITEDAVLVPIAVDIKSDKPFGMGESEISQIVKEKRPEVAVRIGKPINPPKIDGIEKFGEIVEKHRGNQPISKEERELFSRVHQELKTISDSVMKSISGLLPPEKRGEWGKPDNGQ